MNDGIKITGQLTRIGFDAAGIEKYKETFTNLVVKTGRAHIIDRLGVVSQAAMSHMAIGGGTTAAGLDDTALLSELHRNPFTSVTQGVGEESNKITYIADYAPGEGTGTIAEAGIFNSSSAGTMLCRVAFTPRPKDAGDSVRHIWVITLTS